MSYQELLREFEAKQIPLDTPSFYDHTNFLTEELKDNGYLNKYSTFIALRPYTEQYLSEARIKIINIANILHRHFLQSERQGACIDISSILVRVLELEEVWCTCLKGGCSIKFPKSSNEGDVHFYSVTREQLCTPGHYWVYAPPFKIIDLSIKAQAYDGNKRRYIPDFIIAEDTTTSTINAEDIISPDIIYDLIHIHNIPKNKHLDSLCPSLNQVQRHLPAQIVETINGAKIKYAPTATFASAGKLEGFGNIDFNGLTPYELYKEVIAPAVKKS